MTKEQKLLLTVLGCSIRGDALKQLPDMDEFQWTSVKKESHIHTVSQIFFYGIDHLRTDVPEQEYQKLFKLARQYSAHNMRAEYLQQQLVGLLEQERCPYVILKGEAAAAYYPVPEHRLLGDVDFIIPEDRAQEIIEKLKQQGYEHSCEEDEYHQILRKGTDRMELHFEVAGIPQGNAGAAVRAYLADVFDQRRLVRGSTGEFYAPSHAHHGLILLLHMQRHMSDVGLGLRHLMDWSCFVSETWQEHFWQERLLPVLKEIGLFYYCAVMTRTGCICFDLECPEWAQSSDEQLCRELIEDLLAGGNFGRKNQMRARSGNMLPKWAENQHEQGNITLLWKALKRSAIGKNPDMEGRPVRLFGKMVFKAFRYVWLWFTGKRPNLFGVISFANERRSVYDRLRLFETEQ